MGWVRLVIKRFWLTFSSELHLNHISRIVDSTSLLYGQLSKAIVLLCCIADNLFERSVVSVKFIPFFLTEQLLRCRHYVFLAQIGDIAATIVWQLVTSRLDPFHYIFFLPHHLDVLLSNKFKKFAHLLSCRVIAFVVVATAWAILVMFSIVRAQQMWDNSF